MDKPNNRSSANSLEEFLLNDHLFLDVIKNIPNLFITIINNDFVVEFTAGGGFKDSGRVPDEFIGLNTDEIIRESSELIKEKCKATFEGEECRFPLEINNFAYDVKTVPLRSSNGSIERILTVTENITEEIRIKEELKSSEAKYRLLFENSMIGIAITTPDGRMLKMNDAFAKLSGYAIEDISDIHIEKMYADPNDRQTFLAEVSKNGFKKAFEVQLLKKNQKPFWAMISSIPISLGGEDAFLTSMLDITKRIEAEDSLQVGEERFNLAMSVVNEGIWDWHLDTDEEYKDDRYYTMAGYEPHEFPGDTQEWRKRIHPDEVKTANKAIEDYLSGAIDKYDIEFRFKRKDESYMWIRSRGKIVEWDEDGNPKRLVGTHSDITERIQAEQRLRHSEQRFRALHNASFGGIAIHDKGLILECNTGLSEMTGFSHEELIGMNGLLLISDSTRDQVLENINSGYEEAYEAIGVRKNGEEYPIRLEARQIPYKGKEVRVVEFRDITDSKEAEREIRKNKDKLDSIFRVAPTGIGMVKNRVIFEVNPKICEMTGYTFEELIGQPARMLYPTQEEHDFAGEEKYRQISEYGTGAVETLWKRKDGSIINVYLASTPVNVDDLEEGVTFTALDITESKKEEDLLKYISQAGIDFAKTQTEEEIFSVLGKSFWKFRYDFVILLLDETKENLTVPFLTFRKDILKTIRKITGIKLEEFRFPYGDNEIYKEVIRNKETVFIDNPFTAFDSILKNPLGPVAKKITSFIDLTSGILAPLVVEADVIGAVYIQGNDIQQNETLIFSSLANLIAAGLHKARLFRQAQIEIDERIQTEERLIESESNLLKAQELATLGSYIFDIPSDHWSGSDVLNSIFGIDENLKRNFTSWVEILHPDDQKMMIDYFQNEVIGQKKRFDKEYRIISKATQEEKCVHGLGDVSYDSDGNPIEMVGTIQDITERKFSEEQLQYMATHDTLSGLPNRDSFENYIERAINRAKRDNEIIGLLFIDIDNFKSVNDAFGHSVGDWVLQQLSERLIKSVQASDTVARFGGDEFVLLLENIPAGEDALPIAEKIIQSISKSLIIENSEVFITASIGISLYPSDGTDVASLVSCADQAMYKAKEAGKNNCLYYSPEMSSKALERLELKNQLRLALEREEFVVHYQPQVDAETKKIVGIEALIRWQHPDRGLIFPGEFLGMAEESGLIVPIGSWALRESCRQLRQWMDEGLPVVTMAINFSEHELTGQRLASRHLLTEVKNCVEEFQIPPGLLELELSEKIVFQKIETALPQLQELHEFGVKLAIDDFGVGNSTLSQLGLFPFDTLKIDKYFSARVNEFSSDAAVVRGIIAIARNLGLEIVVEGVETREQLIFYNASGCKYIQGWYFSKALPAEQIGEILRKGGLMQPNTPPA